MYEPQEDSYLLAKYVKKLAKGKVLDIGTGSGIQAKAAVKSGTTVTAIDRFKQKPFTHTKIQYKQSNLFSNVRGKYDTLVCNPPYLPQEGKKRHVELEGGKKGWEYIKRLLNKLHEHLNPKGKLLLVFSSLTDKGLVDELIHEQGYIRDLLEEESMFFEKLYCYVIYRPAWWLQLSQKGITDITHWMKGKRGRIFTGKYKGKKVAIKVKHEKVDNSTLAKEARFLKLANTKDIGARFVMSGTQYVVYEFVPGKVFKETPITKKILVNLLQQSRQLDLLGFSKGEMLRPYKNVIINKGKPVLIDFERSKPEKRPQNVSQFCSYLENRHKIPLRKETKAYKDNPSDKTFTTISTRVNQQSPRN
ncbi:MAG: methyltransferase [Candidatus Woesearchaeota archaeon]|jgi:HemK-related putative methylase|nr:methyltransferase [Candidatus Woesearchaeota archaeon]MDP7181504.1 methyltransferase [Candidatus Woesearchaeota archaeon]MDP7198546.1 methyltransferase [Candidatus Woesearchaeota archaeon]MDP7466712.1 methyltransferase [Candidatus Woesearchaeota archaeon]MDP7647185.1 methyltransferase [Candidatus Woesearchaeota archaeon]